MKALKRYQTAWSRHHRSGGFGIHSPFAYNFVRNVWRQRLPYYAYEGFHQLLDTIKTSASRQQRQGMDLISEREARLLFRVTNFFNPGHILQAGVATGVESVVMLEVNSKSHLHLFDLELKENALALRVLKSQFDRVERHNDMEGAVRGLLMADEDNDAPRLALINKPVEETSLTRLLDAQCVLVMRNLNRDAEMSRLFDVCRQHMTAGQTYTNNKIAILNPNPKLQREDFSLWL